MITLRLVLRYSKEMRSYKGYDVIIMICSQLALNFPLCLGVSNSDVEMEVTDEEEKVKDAPLVCKMFLGHALLT